MSEEKRLGAREMAQSLRCLHRESKLTSPCSNHQQTLQRLGVTACADCECKLLESVWGAVEQWFYQ